MHASYFYAKFLHRHIFFSTMSCVHVTMFSTTSINTLGWWKNYRFHVNRIKFTKVGHIVNVICILEVLHFYFASISVFHSTFRSVVKQCIKLNILSAIKTQINLESFCSWADLLDHPTFEFFHIFIDKIIVLVHCSVHTKKLINIKFSL